MHAPRGRMQEWRGPTPRLHAMDFRMVGLLISEDALYFSVLGPPRIWRDGVEIPVGPPQQRLLLALLLAHAGQPVPLAATVDVLWGQDPPPSAVNIVHRHVGMLRRLLEPGLPRMASGRWLSREAGGYRLDVGAETLDLLRFRGALARAREAGRDGCAGVSTGSVISCYMQVLRTRL